MSSKGLRPFVRPVDVIRERKCEHDGCGDAAKGLVGGKYVCDVHRRPERFWYPAGNGKPVPFFYGNGR